MFVLKFILRWLLRLFIAFAVFSLAGVILFKWVPVPATPLMIIRCIQQKADGKEMKMKHNWRNLKAISPKLQLAVVCSEDQNYINHFGFDFKAIEKAIESNKAGKTIRGASTISQQTAKNVFLWPGRSYIRKAFEVWFTFLIELFWSKERIMEVYLNSIEMGNGVYGAEAASQYWFNKPCHKLTKDESAAIAAILPNPLKYIINPPSNYIQKRKIWIKQQMDFWGNKLEYDKFNDDEDIKR
ncbi:MAG: monofunctional biosynthetic peptidoglycan transglycosylase [Bacteroidetes bacterium]|nr:monofunctional biosynthetic peptidoglycan transglycosylase [Bacteroidota bacterium]